MHDVPAAHESSLLLTLEEISQLVAHSHDAAETLANIVRRIQARFLTDVCSVYKLSDDRDELILGATIGLKADSVGRVRMRLDEGLTGLVAQGMVPITVADAFQHPRFKYFPEAGEDPYHSFLGVPLVETGALQGVLVVQTVEPRAFSASEVRMLVTVAAQVAPLVSDARWLEDVIAAVCGEAATAEPSRSRPGPALLSATPLSPGRGLGRAYVLNGCERDITADAAADSEEGERLRLSAAMEATRVDLTRVSQRISELVGEYHGAILQAQLLILQDRAVQRDLHAAIAARRTAESAVVATLNKYVAAFDKLKDPHFRERQYDVKDVFRRILWHLRRPDNAGASEPQRVVLVAHEPSVMDLFSMERDQLAGVVVERGGAQSHAAILARSLGIPMVRATTEFPQIAASSGWLLVDGSNGAVHLNCEPLAVLAAESPNGKPASPEEPSIDWGRGDARGMEIAAAPGSMPDRPDAIDALPVLEANLNLLGEAEPALRQGAQGIGLYRTEFLFLARRTLPTEEEQVAIYGKLLRCLQGRPASIRTFDLRPDKLAQGIHLADSIRTELDWRRVLDSPLLQRLFHDQIRAILRAAVQGNARIVVPLVNHTEQLELVQRTLAAAHAELESEGLDHRTGIPLGIMIESAAAAGMLSSWAPQVDFVALGTNDWLASSLGLDRDDSELRYQDMLHPGWLHSLRAAIDAVHAAGRKVTACGEMASDPLGAAALVSLGADSLSVAVPRLAAVRRELQRIAPGRWHDLAPQLLSATTAAKARSTIANCPDPIHGQRRD